VQDQGVPVDEAERLVAVHRLGLLDTPPSPAFDGVTRLAQAALKVPILCISLVDQGRVWFKSRIGLPAREIPRAGSFCDQVMLSRQTLVVRDAGADPRFAADTLVAGALRVRSYLGIPLFTRDRQPVGTLCAMDTELHEFGEVEEVVLGEFARIAEDLLSSKELASKSDGVLQYAMEREKLFRETFELAPVAIVHTSVHGLILRLNQRASTLLGYSSAELRELSIPSITHPEDLPKNIREFKRLLTGEVDGYRLEQRLLRKDQSYAWTALSVAIKRLPSRQPDYNIVVLDDISAQKQAEAVAAKARDSLQERLSAELGKVAAVEEARDLEASRRDEAQEALRAAEAALQAKGQEFAGALQAKERDLAEALQTTQREFADAVQTMKSELADALKTKERELADAQRIARDTQQALQTAQENLRGTEETLRATKERLSDAQELHRDSQAALQAANAKLAQETATDSLTVLPNRRTFSRRGEQAASALRQSRKPYGLILIDLDDFKQINEEYGHEVGDEVLRALGRIMNTQLRNSSDMAARLGGDEFAVLCFGDINEQTLHDVAERIHTQMGKEPVATPKGLLRYAGSFGLALSNPDDADWKTVYARADAALREAKAAGKDRISFGRSQSKSATTRLRALSSAPSLS
jgi:diguanylate cyclase (GGDEF)-like protein/PAS domain S-box-containing protein